MGCKLRRRPIGLFPGRDGLSATSLRRATIVALAWVLAACAHDDVRKHAAATRSAYDAALAARQAELVAQDRAATARRCAAIARVVTGSARDVTPAGSLIERFVITVRNRGTRGLRRVDGGVTVFGAGSQRLGLSTFSAGVDIEPGRTADVEVGIPLTDFAVEGAGALARASGKHKRVELDLTGYRLAGPTAGGGERD